MEAFSRYGCVATYRKPGASFQHRFEKFVKTLEFFFGNINFAFCVHISGDPFLHNPGAHTLRILCPALIQYLRNTFMKTPAVIFLHPPEMRSPEI
jgi:hypothetical protein